MTTTATRTLGRSGIEVSALGLGGWAIGGAMARGEQSLGYAEAIRRGVELGMRVFDTADAYGASARCRPATSGPGSRSGCAGSPAAVPTRAISPLSTRSAPT
jgi:diketogulonate reductase-like aldo/keto reductase